MIGRQYEIYIDTKPPFDCASTTHSLYLGSKQLIKVQQGILTDSRLFQSPLPVLFSLLPGFQVFKIGPQHTIPLVAPALNKMIHQPIRPQSYELGRYFLPSCTFSSTESCRWFNA